ncbi:MAG: hypothetical protein U9P14_04125, partial [Gemmatimonadota bacterium]|nr:hypothetical protein [Gemmatimonadota bacterium]
MTAVGELEKLILTHDQFISRGQVIEAVEIKKLIGPHLSERDRAARLYRTVNEKAEEFIECAESNFEKFQEIINYKLLAQLEYYYPEYFGALTRALRDSAEKNIEDEQWLYAGLLCASSRTVDADIILSVINYFLGKKQYKQLMLIFERLGETRTAVQDFLAQDGEKTDIPLLEET